ncbi:MAG TPA: hypothetical protein VKN63_05795, partial [Afifellaceae bacterium]|nr:hypothetical protein [Afifellaceae bacterium]
GQAVEQLMKHHARALHVVIVGEDMAVLGHIHPQDFGESIHGGEATVFFTFPNAGRYLVAIDYMTMDGAHAKQFIVDVAGEGVSSDGAPDAMTAHSVQHVAMEGNDRYTRPVLMPAGQEISSG